MGLLLGLTVNFFLSKGPLSTLRYIGNPWHIPIIRLIVFLVQTISSVIVFVVFSKLIIKIKPKLWSSIPIGALLGFLCGGITIGLTFGTLYYLEKFIGISYSPDSLLKITLTALSFGFILGGFAGLPLGAVLGFLVTYFWGYE